MPKLRNAIFVINNWCPADVPRLLACSGFSYICFAEEIGESGTPHLQGYAEVPDQIPFQRFKRLVGVGCWLHARNGSQAQAIAYTKKDGLDSWHEAGERRSQGQRTDLLAIKDAIDKGATMLELAEQNFPLFCHYRRGWSAYMKLKVRPRAPTDPLTVLYWWGDTGTGKSTKAYNDYPGAYWQMTGTKWMEGYDNRQHSVVIFDDYDPCAFTIRQFLTILQSFPLKLEMKGDSSEFIPEIIVITNNVSPDMLYSDQCPRLIAAFERRLTRVVHFPINVSL